MVFLLYVICMRATIRTVLNTEENPTLVEFSCADGIPDGTKQRATPIRLNAYGSISGIRNSISQLVGLLFIPRLTRKGAWDE